MPRVIPSLLAAAILSGAVAAASAQTALPEVPNPAHPFPENPIATDGTSLRSIWPGVGTALANGRPARATEWQALGSPRGRASR